MYNCCFDCIRKLISLPLRWQVLVRSRRPLFGETSLTSTIMDIRLSGVSVWRHSDRRTGKPSGQVEQKEKVTMDTSRPVRTPAEQLCHSAFPQSAEYPSSPAGTSMQASRAATRATAGVWRAAAFEKAAAQSARAIAFAFFAIVVVSMVGDDANVRFQFTRKLNASGHGDK